MTNHILVKFLGPIWFNIAGCLFLGWSWSTSGMGFPSSAGTTISSRVSMSLCRCSHHVYDYDDRCGDFFGAENFILNLDLLSRTPWVGMFLGCFDIKDSLGLIVSIETSPSFATGGRGGLEVRNLFYRELLPSPPTQRGLPQIYGWDMWAIYMRYEIYETSSKTSTSDVWVSWLLRWSSLCRCKIVTPMITLILIWLFCWCEVVAKDNNDKIMLQALLLELKIAFARWLPMVPSSKLMGE